MILAALATSITTLRLDAAPVYRATRLGTLGGSDSYGTAINAAGKVTGYSSITGNKSLHAFLYAGGQMQDLGTLGGVFSAGYAINAAGQVAGSSMPATGERHAFLDSGGMMLDLGVPGSVYSEGFGVNASGQVTGDVDVSQNGPATHAFLYYAGAMTDLGTFGGNNSIGLGINTGGQVTGWASLPNSPTIGPYWHAFLYSNGTMQDLGTFGGAFSRGNAISDRGQVTGEASRSDSLEHAFLYSAGTMSDLGSLSEYGASTGLGINASGQVVGSADIEGVGAVSRAFIYADGAMSDLNPLVVGLARTILMDATGINDSGQVVANGCSPSTICQAFLLDPLPGHPDPPPKLLAIEYRYPAFDHYFFTANAEEIAALDGGMFPGWVRTGESFNVFSAPFFGTASVCRFFSASFAPQSTHFYTQDAGECSILSAGGVWQFEGEVMAMPVADENGSCAAGTQPVYRLFNDGQGGAPAHRFTTSLAIRAQMLEQGWILEGYGINGAIMCAPL